MIHSTRGLFAKIEAGKRKLINVTTKTIDASIKVIKPKKDAPKPTMITTRDIGSADDIAERKKLIAIAEEKKKADKKKKVMAKIIKPTDKAREAMKDLGVEVNKKPWKEMTTEERSIEGKRRAQVAKDKAAKKEKDEKEARKKQETKKKKRKTKA